MQGLSSSIFLGIKTGDKDFIASLKPHYSLKIVQNWLSSNVYVYTNQISIQILLLETIYCF